MGTKSPKKHRLSSALVLLVPAALILTYIWFLLFHSTPQLSSSFQATEYRIDNGIWKPFSTEDLTAASNASAIALRGNFTQEVPSGTAVYFLLRNGAISADKNGLPFWKCDGAASPALIGLPFCSEWLRFPAPGFSPEDTVTFSLTGAPAEQSALQLLQSVYPGEGIDLLMLRLRDHLWQILIGFMLGTLGVTYLVTLYALRGVKGDISKGYFPCGMLFICGGICTLIDYDYITLLFPNIQIVNTLDFISQALICAFLIAYLRLFLQAEWMRKAVRIFVWAIIGMILFYFPLGIAGIFNMTEYVKLLLPVVALLIFATLLLLIMEYHRHYAFSIQLLLRSGITLALTTIVEMLHFYITTVYWIVLFQLGLLIFAVVQFLILIHDAKERLLLAERAERAERKLTENRIAIMISQIQPHFLFNALTAISNLCDKDPKQAKKATVEFSQYLRGNLDSLNQTEPVPFDTELRHIKIYLSLEKMRYEDELNIVYDIETTGFMLPSLTVQPLVENAVKHGLGKSENGGTVTLSAKEFADSFEIIVSDDGVGFDPDEKQADGRTHVGIENVKDRLWSMSGATLRINSQIGKGTTAVIRLPKGAGIK